MRAARRAAASPKRRKGHRVALHNTLSYYIHMLIMYTCARRGAAASPTRRKGHRCAVEKSRARSTHTRT